MRRFAEQTRNATWVLLFALGACAETPLTPPPMGIAAPDVIRANLQYEEVVTLYDDQANGYTFDAYSAEITRHSDGLVIEVGASRAADALTYFHTVNAGDYIVGSLQSLPPPDDQCSPKYPGCVEPYSGGSGSFGTPNIVIRSVSKSPLKRLGGQFGTRFHVPRGRLPRTQGGVSGVELMSSGPLSCLDISRAIYAETDEYRASRNVFLNVMKEVWPPVEWDPNIGSPRIKFDDWPEYVLAFDMAGLRLRRSEFRLNILAGLYRGYGCHDRDWQDVGGAGTTNGTTGDLAWGIAGGGYRLACYDETIEISFDGGSTWETFVATVCDWEQTM